MPSLVPIRRGYTLVELLLVITLASLVLGSVAVLIRGAWRANHAAQSHRELVQSIERLATQFRDDVHSASSVEAAGDKLTIHLPEGRAATYQFEQRSVQRTVMSADKVFHRDDFDLPPETTVDFEIPSGDKNRLAALQISYPLAAMLPELSDRRTLRIDAAVGISRSHAPRGNAQQRRSASITTE